ncbi:MAG: ArnT family glycosyltransferase [Acidobacteriota bacterium]
MAKPKGRRLVGLLLLLSAAAYGLGFLHPRADFSGGPAWLDGSGIADEGWYAGAAIHHFVQGHWYLPDVLNSAVTMPVWPVLLGLWFKITGVSMLWARTLTMLLYGLSLTVLYRVMWRARPGRLAALVVLLAAIDPFGYAFNRLAILEPVTGMWFMCALWLAGTAKPRDWLKQSLLGVVIFLLLLTKISGVALVPAVLYMMGASWGQWVENQAERPKTDSGLISWRGMVVSLVLTLGLPLALWEGYLRLLIQPHAMLDYTLLAGMATRHVTFSSLPAAAWTVLQDGLWISPVLFPLALLIMLLSVVWLRELWGKPLFGAAVLAVAGQMAYLGFHGEVPARSLLPILMPVMIVVGLGVGAVIDRRRLCSKGSRQGRRMRWMLAVTLLTVMVSLGMMGVQTLEDVLHQEYSYWEAAQGIAAIVAADGGSRPMLLSDSGDDLTLWTGLPAVSATRTTHGLDAVLARYQPGWFAAWPGREDVAIAQVGMRYRMDAVARYRVFDDPRQQILVLYKLTRR